MGIQSTTGHSAKGERKVAGLVYLFIGIAVCSAIILFFALGKNKSFGPSKSEDPTRSAPDSTPGTKVEPEAMPAPASNPSDKNQ